MKSTTDEQKNEWERFREYRDCVEEMVGIPGRSIPIGGNTEHPFWVLIFDNTPENGSMTAFTFGISSIKNSKWVTGAPELVVSIGSNDDNWGLTLGAVSEAVRGEFPFSLGSVLDIREPITKSTRMSQFFLFWPTILTSDQTMLEMSDRTVNIIQAYPIYEQENIIIRRIGAVDFFMTSDLDFYDVNRTPCVK